MDLLLERIQRVSEAWFVMHGIPITRRYSDEELAEALEALRQAERDIKHMHEESRHAEATA